MREILFRGKRIGSELWEYGFFTTGEHFLGERGKGKTYILDQKCPMFSEIVPETVGQSTGLADINGKMIFEGDILKVKTLWHAEFSQHEIGIGRIVKQETYWTVEWKDYNAESGFFVFGVDRRWHKPLTWSRLYNAEAEVVGNIHDNPEIIKNEKEKKK